MRTFIRRATMVAGITLLSAAPAYAATGGGTTATGGASSKKVQAAEAAATPAAAADPIVVKPVALTKSQTKSVQRRVRVKPDGALGSGTRRAIKRFQRVKTLTLTGAPNVETLRAMNLKIADKLEAKLRAEAAGTAVNQPVSLAAPTAAAGQALAAARTAIGTPYRSAGTTLAGFDCSGLTLWAFGQAGIKLPRTSFDQYGVGVAVPKDQIQPGDLVFFDSNGAGASHVGIAASATTMISATSHGVMEHTIATGYWAGHYVGARRVSVTAKAASVN